MCTASRSYIVMMYVSLHLQHIGYNQTLPSPYLLIYICILIRFRIVHITVVLTKITKIGSCQNICASVRNTLTVFVICVPYRYTLQSGRTLAW